MLESVREEMGEGTVTKCDDKIWSKGDGNLRLEDSSESQLVSRLSAMTPISYSFRKISLSATSFKISLSVVNKMV